MPAFTLPPLPDTPPPSAFLWLRFRDGAAVGTAVGVAVGTAVGVAVGTAVGVAVGAAVGVEADCSAASDWGGEGGEGGPGEGVGGEERVALASVPWSESPEGDCTALPGLSEREVTGDVSVLLRKGREEGTANEQLLPEDTETALLSAEAAGLSALQSCALQS